MMENFLKKSSSLLLTLLVLTVFGKAQPYVDILKLQYRHFPGTAYSEDVGARLTTERMNGELFIPLQLKSDDIIILGSSFDWLQLRYKSGYRQEKGTLYGTSLRLGGIKQWNEHWSTMLLAIPRLSSDFETLSSKHFQMGGVALVIYEHTESLKIKAGLYYNREYFGNYFMPLAGIEWNASERLNVFGVLPGGINMEYQLGPRFYTGISYRSLTGSFRLSQPSADYYVREGHSFWGHNQLWAFLDYYPMQNVVLGTGIGHTSWRRYDLYNIDDQLMSGNAIYQPFNDGIFIHLELAYRIRLDSSQTSDQ